MVEGSWLRGRTALITGAAKRVGRQTALAFADEGANVVVHYRSSEDEAKSLASELAGKGVKACNTGQGFSCGEGEPHHRAYPDSQSCEGTRTEADGPAVQAMHGRGWQFYTHVSQDNARLMCSWDTTTEDVDAFAADLAEVMAHRHQGPAPGGG